MDEKIIKIESIESRILSLEPAMRGSLKCEEIAKIDCSGESTDTKSNLKIEIVGEVKKIEENSQSGIVVFARAWRNDKQLGFGEDGSVEIERFRIFNPPVLVEDPDGDIIREYTNKFVEGIQTIKFREDPAEAIRQSLYHTINLIGKEDTKIEIGKVGNTTDTFYPNTNAYIRRYPNDVGSTWADIRDGAGTYIDTAPINDSTGVEMRSGDSGAWAEIERSIYCIITSSLGSGATISSATFSVYGTGKQADAGNYDTNVYGASPDDPTSLVMGDYDNCGTTAFCDTPISQGDWSTTGYNDFVFNATGLAAISKTGTTSLSLRNAGNDVANSQPANPGNRKLSYKLAYYKDQTGTSSDPKLVITYTSASGPANLKTWNGLAKASVKSINGLAIASVKTVDGLA